MADVEMMPLPEPVAVRYPDSGLRGCADELEALVGKEGG